MTDKERKELLAAVLKRLNKWSEIMKPDTTVVDELMEAMKALPQTVWVIGKTYPDDVWMCEGIFDTEEEAVENCKEDEFVAHCSFGERLPDDVRDVLCIYWPNEETKEDGMAKLVDLRKEPLPIEPRDDAQSEVVDKLFDERKDAKVRPLTDLLVEEEPEPPEGYGELKVGMEGKLNGVPVVVRKITKKDIILRPMNKSIKDEHGLMVSFKEGKASAL